MGVRLGPKENPDVESSSKTDKPLVSFCVENISVTVWAKSRKQSALGSFVPGSMTAWQTFWAVSGTTGSYFGPDVLVLHLQRPRG